MVHFGLEQFIPHDPGTILLDDYCISDSLERDHGIACYYPIGWYILNRGNRPTRETNFVWQTYTYCLNFLGMLAAYGIVKAITSRRHSACIAALILFLCPRMFAEMHYNNKDMVSLMLCLGTLYFGVRWILEKKRRFAVGFGIVAAFAVNGRLVAAFVFGLVGLNVLIPLIMRAKYVANNEEKATTKSEFITGFIAIGVCALTYVLITPALWRDPVGFAKHLIKYTLNFSRWNDLLLFEGKIYIRPESPLPRYYLIKYILISTPIWVSLLIFSGTVLVWVRGIRSRFVENSSRVACMVSLAGLFPLLFAVIMRTHVYNGWRQFYFVFGPMSITAAMMVDTLFERLKNKKILLGTASAALAGCIVCTGIGVIKNHPYQYGYVNVFAGENPSKEYELDYWNLSSGPMIRKLMETIVKDRNVTLSAFVTHDYHALVCARLQLSEEQKTQIELTSCDISADYILINLSYSYRIGMEQLKEIESKYHIIMTCESYGNPMMLLYEKNSLK